MHYNSRLSPTASCTTVKEGIHHLPKSFTIGKQKYSIAEVTVALICIIPALILATVFVLVPIVQVFYLGFTDWHLLKGTRNFIGWDNYSYLLQDEKFLKSIRNTFIFSFIKIPLDMVLALSCAVLLDQVVPFRRFFRAAYFEPVVVPVVASALIWIWFYDPNIGPFNQILQWLGLEPLQWLHSEKTAMLSIILFATWKGLGYDIVIFLAGLQSVPNTYVEAAKIDGATSWQIFRKIKLPLLSPVIYFVLLMGIVNSFKVFTEISVMTPKGGPLYSTAVMVFYIYEQAFNRSMMGRAAAAAVILFVIVLILTQIQKIVGSKHVHYD